MPAKKPSKRARKTSHPLKISAGEWNRQAVMDIVHRRLIGSHRTLNMVVLDPWIDEDGKEWPLPPSSTIREWAFQDREIWQRLDAARRFQIDSLNDQILDESSRGEVVDRIDVARIGVRAQYVKWYAGVTHRDRFGPKQEVEHSGSIDVERLKAALQGEGVAGIAAEWTKPDQPKKQED